MTYEQNEKKIADSVCPQNAANRGGLALYARRKIDSGEPPTSR